MCDVRHFSLKKTTKKNSTAQQRGFIISAFYNHVRRLVRHSEASYVLEAAYNNHANAQQRWRLVQEFYGPQFALFKDSEAQSLEEVFLASNPSEKATICRHMKEALLPLLERFFNLSFPSFPPLPSLHPSSFPPLSFLQDSCNFFFLPTSVFFFFSTPDQS